MRQLSEPSASAVQSHVGLSSFVAAAGRAVIVGWLGACRSSWKLRVASAPVFPAGSVARTRKV